MAIGGGFGNCACEGDLKFLVVTGVEGCCYFFALFWGGLLVLCVWFVGRGKERKGGGGGAHPLRRLVNARCIDR